MLAIFYNGSNLALNGNDPLNPDYTDVSQLVRILYVHITDADIDAAWWNENWILK